MPQPLYLGRLPEPVCVRLIFPVSPLRNNSVKERGSVSSLAGTTLCFLRRISTLTRTVTVPLRDGVSTCWGKGKGERKEVRQWEGSVRMREGYDLKKNRREVKAAFCPSVVLTPQEARQGF